MSEKVPSDLSTVSLEGTFAIFHLFVYLILLGYTFINNLDSRTLLPVLSSVKHTLFCFGFFFLHWPNDELICWFFPD